jgi:membrane-bound serine protease (ClpP class)
MTGFQKFLSAIAHPNIAYILMTLGGLGLYFELSNPGAILPGVVGGICLILAFFALSVLPVNYAGIALIILALIFFIAEVKVISYGLLTVAGVISLILGSLMLFKSADPAIRVSLNLIMSMAVFTLLIVTFLLSMVVRAHRTQVATGVEGLLHEQGVTRTRVDRSGKVFVHGEIWNASADEEIAAGSPVEVVGVEGLSLHVRPVNRQTFQSNGEGT